jgi:hypothetical protein
MYTKLRSYLNLINFKIIFEVNDPAFAKYQTEPLAGLLVANALRRLYAG